MSNKSEWVEMSEVKTSTKQIAAFKGELKEFPEHRVVKRKDAHGVHVIYVTKKADMERETIVHTANYQVMNQRQWEITRKSKSIPGVIIVLHDPTKEPKGGWPNLTATAVNKIVGEEAEAEEEK